MCNKSSSFCFSSFRLLINRLSLVIDLLSNTILPVHCVKILVASDEVKVKELM